MAMLETAFRYAKKVWDFVDNLGYLHSEVGSQI